MIKAGQVFYTHPKFFTLEEHPQKKKIEHLVRRGRRSIYEMVEVYQVSSRLDHFGSAQRITKGVSKCLPLDIFDCIMFILSKICLFRCDTDTSLRCSLLNFPTSHFLYCLEKIPDEILETLIPSLYIEREMYFYVTWVFKALFEILYSFSNTKI